MKVRRLHPWRVSPKRAIAIQEQLRAQIIRVDSLETVQRVAGVDVGFEANNTLARAAVAVLTFPELQLCEQAVVRKAVSFPYVPGLLSFREVPAVLDALRRLETQPDLLLCDGQGYAHPRRFGLACHLGLLLDMPSIGVAKTRLIGEYSDVPDARGSWVPLRDKGETIGAVLRTRIHVRPLYISVGHRISLTTAIDYVMQCTPRYRLPETTRWAHRLASPK